MKQNIAIPIAIVIAAALVAGALFLGGRAANPSTNQNQQEARTNIDVPAVTAEDHILGNPDAPVVIIEYSDLECPFCKEFHTTMKRVMREYGESGDVAWVYRHFPITQLHPNAPRLAEASECVAELGGDSAFWDFVDEIFALAPGNERFPMDQLTQTAGKVGVDEAAFDACLASSKYQDMVAQQFDDARTAGAQGTPHNIIVMKNGDTLEMAGAQEYATVKNVVDTILAETQQ